MAARTAGLALAVLLFVVYLVAPVQQITDSSYSLLLSHSVVFDRSFTLTRYFPLPLEPDRYPGIQPDDVIPYHLTPVGRDLYYFFPVGGSLLAAPIVTLADLLGVGPVSADGHYLAEAEARLQIPIAAALMALWAWLVYLTARVWLPVPASFLVGAVAGLGTQAMSTASRGLWSDTWALVILQAVLLLLLRARPSPALVATLLAWLYFVRPQHAISILAIVAIMALRRRDLLPRTIAYGTAWLVAFVAFALYHYGTLLPPYHLVTRLSLQTFGLALFGNLVSPTRGLLVYVPVTLFVTATLVLRWRQVRERALVAIGALAFAGYFVMTSSYPTWWGGWSYGPRLMTGTLPWLVLLGVHSVCSLPPSPGMRRVLVGFAAVTATVSILINGAGAFAVSTWHWHDHPGGYTQDAYRLWNWRDPQFLRLRDPGPPVTTATR